MALPEQIRAWLHIAAARDAGNADQREDPRSAMGKGRILILEDEFLVGAAVAETLKNAGYAVIGIAETAAAAVDLAQSQSPDLVLADIRLPGEQDGIVAAREILERTGIRCIFATAYADDATKSRAATAWPVAWLPKPYSADQLVRGVAKALAILHRS